MQESNPSKSLPCNFDIWRKISFLFIEEKNGKIFLINNYVCYLQRHTINNFLLTLIQIVSVISIYDIYNE